jgi:hypothetical protein
MGVTELSYLLLVCFLLNVLSTHARKESLLCDQ